MKAPGTRTRTGRRRSCDRGPGTSEDILILPEPLGPARGSSQAVFHPQTGLWMKTYCRSPGEGPERPAALGVKDWLPAVQVGNSAHQSGVYFLGGSGRESSPDGACFWTPRLCPSSAKGTSERRQRGFSTSQHFIYENKQQAFHRETRVLNPEVLLPDGVQCTAEQGAWVRGPQLHAVQLLLPARHWVPPPRGGPASGLGPGVSGEPRTAGSGLARTEGAVEPT